MKLVTYDAGAGPARRRARVRRRRRRRLRRRHGRLHRSRRAGRAAASRSRGARLLAPLRPRTLRDFLAFEGHLKNAYRNLGREIPQEWYEIPAYYKGMPDTVDRARQRSAWPAYSEELDHELELAAIIGARVQGRRARRTPRGCVFGYTIWNDLSARDVQRREGAVGMGPGKAKDWDGSNVLGPCIVTAGRLRRLRRAYARARQRRGLGRGHERPHAPHLRGHDRLRLAQPDAAAGRGDRVGHGRGRLRASSSGAGSRPATSSSSRSTASASCATPSDRKEHDHGVRRLRQVAREGGQGGPAAGGHPRR